MTQFGNLRLDPQEVSIRSANAERLSRRQAASALANSVQRTSGQSLDRRAPTRQIGGTFESLQAVPDRTVVDESLQLSDLLDFLSAFNFAPTNETLGSRSFFSSFGPNIIGLEQ